MRIVMVFSPHLGNRLIPPQPHVAGNGPVAIGRFVAPVAGKTLSRGGTAMAGLLAQWAAIAGPSLAAHTMPAKMTRAAPEPAFPGKTGPSVLLLKVDPIKALEVQYAIPQLIERINGALGYKAVASVRLVQSPFSPVRKKAAQPQPAPLFTGVANKPDRLGSALARMAAGVKARAKDC